MSTNWWEIRILCEPALEETIFWRLEEFGFQGMSTESKGHAYLIHAYLLQQKAHLLDLSALSLFLRQDALCMGLSIPAVQWDLIDEEDWASSWKVHWHPQEIGDRFLINPAWIPVPEHTDRLVLRLEPGAAFGTGDHATTQLCLEALEMRLGGSQSNSTIADIGCGSGVLAIGALLLGAQTVYAVDTDLLAVQSTLGNRTLNQLDPDRLIVEQGSVEQVAQLIREPVDGIVCNILAEVIIDLVPMMTEIAKPSTWGILSGLLLDQAKPVADTLEENGWIVATLWRRQDWCCMTIRRS